MIVNFLFEDKIKTKTSYLDDRIDNEFKNKMDEH